jgi:hypothetical protein
LWFCSNALDGLSRDLVDISSLPANGLGGSTVALVGHNHHDLQVLHTGMQLGKEGGLGP